jgi:hypothetical protein
MSNGVPINTMLNGVPIKHYVKQSHEGSRPNKILSVCAFRQVYTSVFTSGVRVELDRFSLPFAMIFLATDFLSLL